jgi:LacI family transcriptional regulator
VGVVTDTVEQRAERRRRGPAPRGRPNIRDVARLAGVSVATVSRVMSGSDLVATRTRERVLTAIADLDFVANGHARALGGTGTPTLALVVNQIFGASFAVLARGVEHIAAERRHLFVMCTAHDSAEREAEVISMLQQQRPVAVLWLGPLEDDLDQERRVAHYNETLNIVGSRLIVCGRDALRVDPSVTSVGYDNTGGTRAMLEHLIELGHRSIMFVGARPGHLASQHRLAGYLEAMTAAGLPTPPRLRPAGDFSAESGRLAVREALAKGTRFTAVAAAVDSVALGVIHELNAAGLKVPDDVSVTGFDDVDALPGLDLGLTSAHAPFEEVGRTAAELALDPTAEPSHHTLPVTVHVRTTTARVRATRRARGA